MEISELYGINGMVIPPFARHGSFLPIGMPNEGESCVAGVAHKHAAHVQLCEHFGGVAGVSPCAFAPFSKVER